MHFYKFSIAFILISILWISLIGIVTPVLFISVLAFGYYGIIVSLLSLVLGSIINFFMATKTKSAIKKKLQHKKPFFSEDPFLIFIIFRLIPGIPYLIKNLSVIFFKLNLKKIFFSSYYFRYSTSGNFYFFFKKTY